MSAAREKILIIKLGALGDFIQALGPMAGIRRHHPAAHITLMTTAPFQEFAARCGYADETWIDERPSALDIAGWMRLKKKLNDGGFSRVYDLQNNDRTALYFRLFRKKPEWAGAVKGASHRNADPARSQGHAFDGHVQTLALAGVTGVTIDRLEWLKANIGSFGLRRPYVLLIPGSAPERPEKRWPVHHYARLSHILEQAGYQPVIIGGAAERALGLAGEIQKESPFALDLTGQTGFDHIAEMARGAAGAIGNDTGPLHLIAATGCPCLALFSKTSDIIKHAPRGDRATVLQARDLEELKPEKAFRAFRPRELPPVSQPVSLH